MIAELAVDLGRVHARRDNLTGEIEEVFLAHPFGELLVTLSGIGPRTRARILAEIGDGTVRQRLQTRHVDNKMGTPPRPHDPRNTPPSWPLAAISHASGDPLVGVRPPIAPRKQGWNRSVSLPGNAQGQTRPSALVIVWPERAFVAGLVGLCGE